MQINVTFDTSVANAPGGLNAGGAFEAAVDYVVNLYDTLFTNNVTLNIDVGYGELDNNQYQVTSNALGESYAPNNLIFGNYTQLRNTLIAEGAPGSSSLPVTDPMGGRSLVLNRAEQKALGLLAANDASAPDGYVGFSSYYPLSYTPNVTPTGGSSYFIGVVEHEFSEVMGRVSDLDIPGEYAPIDLFRYQAAGVRQTSAHGTTAYFSINNGITDLADWNPDSNNGDLADWKFPNGPVNDAYNNGNFEDTLDTLSLTDLTLMRSLGWTEPPPLLPGGPGTLWLTRSGSDLVARILGSSTTTTITGWFTGEVSLTLPDGSTVGAIEIAAIEQAMATYQTANPGFNPATATTMPGTPTLLTALNTNWSRSISGSAGNDTIDAGFGSDTITGGSGDVADYSASWTSVNVNLAIGTAAHGSATDTLTNIEGVIGSANSDTLIAGSAGSELNGGPGGDDSIVGGAGPDTLIGSGGHATLHGGTGNDVLVSGSGATTFTLTVGDGQDELAGFKPGTDTLSLAGGPSVTATTEIGPALLTKDADGVVSAVYGDGTQAAWGMVSPGSEGVVGASDGHGHGEVMWEDPSSGAMTLWTVNPSGGAPVVTSEPSTTPMWSVVASGDFDGNGSSDFLFRNATTNQYYVWLMSGTAVVGGGVVATSTSGWEVGAVGDFDGNGTSDVELFNTTTGQLFTWLMSGGSIAGGGLTGTLPTGSSLLGAADFNGDGKADLVLRNADGSVSAWLMNGASVTGTLSLAGAGSVGSGWTFEGIGKVNGVSDLVWQTAPGTLVEWLGGSPSNAQTVTSSGTIASGVGIGSFMASTQLSYGSGSSVELGGIGAGEASQVTPVATWSFANASAGVVANLASGAVSIGGVAQGSIAAQNLIGSSFSDVLTAGTGGSSISGGAGDDTLVSGAGSDTLDGGSGFNVVSYANSTAGVSVNLATGATSGGYAQGDVLANIEGVIGSANSDTLIAGSAGSELNGGPGGDDSIVGGAGPDTLIGSGGHATLHGGTGNDVLVSGSGATTFTLTVGDGQDELAGFKPGTDTLSLAGGPSVTATTEIGPALLTKDADGVVSAVYGDGTQAAWGMVSPGSEGVVGASDGHGHGEVMWEDPSSGAMTLWTVNPSGGAPVVTSEPSTTPMWSVVASGDFDGNGSSDFLFRNATTNQYYVWLMSGTAVVGGGVVATSTSGWEVGAVGDFDGNGTSDVELFNTTTGQLFTWLMSGGSIAGGGLTGTLPTGSSLLGAADFNGDGKADLVLRNADGSVSAWLMNGASVTGTLSLAGAGSVGSGWTFEGIGKVNGVSDLVWQTAPGTLVEWLGGSPSNAQTVTSSGTIASGVGIGSFMASTQLSYGSGSSVELGGIGAGEASQVTPVATWSFANASAGVVANLASGAVSIGGVAQGSIAAQSLIGSSFSDVLTAGTGGSSISGGAGDDTLVSGAGSDTLDGGSGFNVVSYANSTAGVSVNLATGATSGGYAQGDVLANIEGVIGSANSDTLIAGSAGSELNGGPGGDDSIVGGAGPDTLIGSGGHATLHGGTGNDVLVSGSGATTFTLTVGDGQDELAGFKPGTDTLSLAGGPSVTATTEIGPALLTKDADGVVSAVYGDGTQAAWGMVSPGSEGVVGASDGHGHGEVMWEDPSSGAMTLWTVSPSGGAPVVTSEPSTSPGWSVVASGDFDGNGSSDFLFRNATTGQYYAWLMNGTSIVGGGVVATAPVGWVVGAIGDFDGNGTSDIELVNSTTGQLFTWLMSGTTVVGGGPQGTLPTGSSLLGAADFNGDGKADLVLRNADGSVSAWLMNGASVTGTLSLAGAGSVGSGWTFEGIGKVNGVSDLVWQTAPGTLVEWLGGSPSNAQTVTSSGTIASGVGIGSFMASTQLSYGSGSSVELGGIGAGEASQVTPVATWSFANASAGVVANLASGAVSIGGVAQGSIAAQSLIGSSFNDVLTAGTGNNTLTGGGGYDTYAVGRGGGQDTVVNAAATNSGPSGELDFGANIATNQLWLLRAGNDLQIDVMGTSEHVTVAGWYAAANAPLQHIVTADGSKLDGQLSNLVSAMATFSANNPGFDPTATANSQAPNDLSLQTALAADWHH